MIGGGGPTGNPGGQGNAPRETFKSSRQGSGNLQGLAVRGASRKPGKRLLGPEEASIADADYPFMEDGKREESKRGRKQRSQQETVRNRGGRRKCSLLKALTNKVQGKVPYVEKRGAKWLVKRRVIEGSQVRAQAIPGKRCSKHRRRKKAAQQRRSSR